MWCALAMALSREGGPMEGSDRGQLSCESPHVSHMTALVSFSGSPLSLMLLHLSHCPLWNNSLFLSRFILRAWFFVSMESLVWLGNHFPLVKIITSAQAAVSQLVCLWLFICLEAKKEILLVASVPVHWQCHPHLRMFQVSLCGSASLPPCSVRKQWGL